VTTLTGDSVIGGAAWHDSPAHRVHGCGRRKELRWLVPLR